MATERKLPDLDGIEPGWKFLLILHNKLRPSPAGAETRHRVLAHRQLGWGLSGRVRRCIQYEILDHCVHKKKFMRNHVWFTFEWFVARAICKEYSVGILDIIFQLNLLLNSRTICNAMLTDLLYVNTPHYTKGQVNNLETKQLH